MYIQRLVLIFTLLGFLVQESYSYGSQLNILSYNLTIEPDIANKYITGSVVIKFQLGPGENSISLNSGNLQIDQVTGSNVNTYRKKDNDLIIELTEKRELENEISISYHGNPSRGLLFSTEPGQAYTVYFTDHWMVCHNAPHDRAKINMNIITPKGKDCIANGRLIKREEKAGKVLYQWSQSYESPAYTYGFVIGNFDKLEISTDKTKIINYASNYSLIELKKIFRESAKMLSFFEEKSGIDYGQPTYSQILIGNHYQEMSGFSILKETYGKLVLEDSTETNLISHELAHQWWGNRVTCKNWNHFWLNEAIVTYMSAAYNEYRFGKEKYNSDINSYFNVYQDIKNRNKDKPLVFEDWSNPSRDDRNIVYFKGAYVLHLLRKEIGDQIFWSGIRHYSMKYFDKSVTTLEFQNTIEEVAGRDLDFFFDEWVY